MTRPDVTRPGAVPPSAALSSLMDVFEVGPKVRRVLLDPRVRNVPLADYARERDVWSAAVLSIQSTGTVTAKAVDVLVDLALAGRVGDVAGVLPARTATAKVPFPDGVSSLGRVPGTARSAEPEDVIRFLASQLQDMRRLVVARRFGIDGSAAVRLRVIAEDHSLSRSRIQQIEATALKWMRRQILDADPMRDWVIRDFADFASATFADASFVDWTVVVDLYEARPWPVRLAAATLGLRFADLIDCVGVRRHRYGLLAPGLEPKEFERLQRALAKAFATEEVVPLTAICERTGLTVEDVRRVSGAPGLPVIYRDYVLKKPLSKPKRVVDGHRAALLSGPVFDRASWQGFVAGSESADVEGGRDLSIAVATSPGLICHLQGDFYYAMGRLDSALPRLAGPPHAASPSVCGDGGDDPSEDSHGPTRTSVIRFLQERGPSNIPQILEISRMSGVITEFSISALLATLGRVRRVSPGVYDLYGSPYRGDWSTDPVPDGLINIQTVMSYVAFRRGGDVGRCYYWWTPSFEWRLCQWTLENLSDRAMFSRLMCVVDPTSWGVSKGQESTWLYLKRERGEWVAPIVAFDPSSPSFTLRDFLGFLVILESFGASGPGYANRICGARPDAFVGLGLLFLAVALGAAVPRTADWSQGVVATPSCSSVRRAVEAVVYGDGMASWGKASGLVRGLLRPFEGVEGMTRAQARGFADDLLKGRLPPLRGLSRRDGN